MQIMQNCPTCKGPRKHVLTHREHSSAEVSPGVRVSVWVSVLRCLSCEQLLAVHAQNVEGGGLDGPVIYTVAPPLAWRTLPKWLDGPKRGEEADGLGPYVMAVLRQVYVAANADALELAAMGVRSIWERLMIEAVGDHGSFRANLAAYQASGAITLRQHEALETVFELGHATTHRGFRPTRGDLATVFDVTESLLRPLYDEGRVRSLRDRIPPRSR